jgi:hypothetical protein
MQGITLMSRRGKPVENFPSSWGKLGDMEGTCHRSPVENCGQPLKILPPLDGQEPHENWILAISVDKVPLEKLLIVAPRAPDRCDHDPVNKRCTTGVAGCG